MSGEISHSNEENTVKMIQIDNSILHSDTKTDPQVFDSADGPVWAPNDPKTEMMMYL